MYFYNSGASIDTQGYKVDAANMQRIRIRENCGGKNQVDREVPAQNESWMCAAPRSMRTTSLSQFILAGYLAKRST